MLPTLAGAQRVWLSKPI